jgi:hypothetical protein
MVFRRARIRATFMVLRWDCDATFAAFTVPPQGHYSIYHVGYVLRALVPNS